MKKKDSEETATDKSDLKNEESKQADLARHKESGLGELLTTNQGTRINDNQNSLKAGSRGPSLLEDFILREKITHFDHERIPERVVHARGSGAHGYFEVYESMAEYTRADFLQNPKKKTPVFVRFSTVAGSRGSSDLARDVRGFAVKFYTDEGVFDLVGNNIPVFFIQDAIKFPDLVHAVKPEPHHQMPQAASAHNTFWDFISLTPESIHMILWVMSDRAIPRSYRMMEGFGVHTFRFVNAEGTSRFVKFHWKPLLGMHSVVWDEAQKISGKDPDFHRRDLFEAIESGDFPEYELGVQIVEEDLEHAFDFDLLDATKLIPEELVPVQRIGKLTLNRNPDNFFAETEQVAFHVGHIVPGIDFTNDPLLHGRLFSYTDTQLTRLGGPNFHEIPINRSVAPVHNNQRDGFMRQTINKGRAAYEPNSTGGGCPFQAGADMGGFVSFAEKMEETKIRTRSKSFLDHYSQARLFYNSQTEIEKDHIVRAFRFELGKVDLPDIRQKMVNHLAQVDRGLATRVAEGLGLSILNEIPPNRNVPADADPAEYQSRPANPGVSDSPALSIVRSAITDSIRSRKVAILCANGCNDQDVQAMQQALTDEGAYIKVVAPVSGYITTAGGDQLKVHHSLLTTSSVLFDAVFIPSGVESVRSLKKNPMALEFILDAYRHCKAIAGSGDAQQLLQHFYQNGRISDEAILVGSNASEIAPFFVRAIANHRNWKREQFLERIQEEKSGTEEVLEGAGPAGAD